MAKKGITGAKKITVNDALKLYDSTAMIGNVHERFDILTSHPDHLRQDLDWRSFYDGWIEGRFGMYGELYTMETIRRAQELARRFADVKKDELEAIHDLLKQMEWVGDHTDYEDSWAVTTCACPCCRNAKTDGHKPGCILKQFIDKGGKNEETVHVRNLR